MPPSLVTLPRTTPAWPVEPMMAKLGKALPPEPARWAYELKWDGYRALLWCVGEGLRVQSRNGHDITRTFPELQGIAQALRRDAVLDGEVVVMDAEGRPDFGALQRRAGFGPARSKEGPTPGEPTFIAFDLLSLDGEPLVGRPWAQRRAALEGLDLRGPRVALSPVHDDGDELWAAAEAMGLEGVVAKRRDAPYEAGARTGAWVKVKRVHEQEFVVGGWSPGQGSRRLGALLVGYHEGRALRFAGSVGSGITEAHETALLGALRELAQERSPFAPDAEVPREARFVEPALVAVVQFRGWTQEGHLRQPAFKGLRSDKDPEDVVKEVP